MATIETIQQGEAHPTLSHHEQIEVGRELQATLVELINLALLGKHLHWSVVGAGFRSLHLQLDELNASWSALADTVAERAVAVGYWPDGQATTVAEVSEFAQVMTGPLPDREVIQVLTHRLIETVANCRARIASTGSHDLASQDVLIKVVLVLEKQLWMVRAQARALSQHDPRDTRPDGNTHRHHREEPMDESTLNPHQRTTIEKIFSHPSSANIEWRSVRALLDTLGATEGANGKLTVTLGAETETIEEPRGKDIDQQLIVDLRRMLRGAGYTPGGQNVPAPATSDGA